MKKLYLFISLFIAGATFGQNTVSNAGFENWTSDIVKDSVEFWSTSTTDLVNLGVGINNTYRIAGAQDGNYAMHMETLEWVDGMSTDTLLGYTALQQAGDDFFGMPYTDTVDVISGYYKCDVAAGDQAMCIVELSKNHVVYSTAAYLFTGTQSAWTQFSLPLPNGASDEPDSVFIAFVSSDPFTPGVATAGSWLEIDNVTLEFTSGSMTTPSPLPNHSFENNVVTTLETPDNWWSFDPTQYNIYQESYVKKSTDAASGSYALEVSMTASNDSTGLVPIVTNGSVNFSSGNFEGGDLFWAQPDSLVGQFKYTPNGIDTAFALLEMWNATSGLIVYEVKSFSTLSAGYQAFSIPLTFTEAPDSMRLTFFAGEEVGSKLLIDDLQFIGGDVGISNKENIDFSMYPNPATNHVTLNYSEGKSLTVYDLSGRLLLNSTLDQSGIVDINTSEWTPGIYMVNLISDNKEITKKLIVK